MDILGKLGLKPANKKNEKLPDAATAGKPTPQPARTAPPAAQESSAPLGSRDLSAAEFGTKRRPGAKPESRAPQGDGGLAEASFRTASHPTASHPTAQATTLHYDSKGGARPSTVRQPTAEPAQLGTNDRELVRERLFKHFGVGTGDQRVARLAALGTALSERRELPVGQWLNSKRFFHLPITDGRSGVAKVRLPEVLGVIREGLPEGQAANFALLEALQDFADAPNPISARTISRLLSERQGRAAVEAQLAELARSRATPPASFFAAVQEQLTRELQPLLTEVLDYVVKALPKPVAPVKPRESVAASAKPEAQAPAKPVEPSVRRPSQGRAAPVPNEQASAPIPQKSALSSQSFAAVRLAAFGMRAGGKVLDESQKNQLRFYLQGFCARGGNVMRFFSEMPTPPDVPRVDSFKPLVVRFGQYMEERGRSREWRLVQLLQALRDATPEDDTTELVKILFKEFRDVPEVAAARANARQNAAAAPTLSAEARQRIEQVVIAGLQGELDAYLQEVGKALLPTGYK